MGVTIRCVYIVVRSLSAVPQCVRLRIRITPLALLENRLVASQGLEEVAAFLLELGLPPG